MELPPFLSTLKLSQVPVNTCILYIARRLVDNGIQSARVSSFLDIMCRHIKTSGYRAEQVATQNYPVHN